MGTFSERMLPSEKAMIVYDSVVTCPKCGHQSQEAMSADACEFFYTCKRCGSVSKPLPGHCCIFCSYGSVPCPPIQQARGYT